MTIEQKIAELVSESDKLATLQNEEIVSEEVVEVNESEMSKAQILKKINDGTHEAMTDVVPGKHVELRHTATGKKSRVFVKPIKEESEQIDETGAIPTPSPLASWRKYTQAAKNAREKGDHDIAKDAEEKAKRYAASYKRVTGKEPTMIGEEEELKVDVSEDVNALVNGENLSEEFKTKAATIFEAAVVTRVKQELARLEEEFDNRVAEQVEVVKEGIIEKVDGYLNYVVEQWMTDNELALENGVKLEIFESLVVNMKSVFEQHNIEIPEDKYDVLGDLSEQVEQTSAKLDEQVAANIKLKKEINEMKRQAAIKEACEGMVELDVEKFSALAEELSYEDSDSFASKLQTIKENYFGKKTTAPVVTSVVTDTPVDLKEDAKPTVEVDPRMKAYLKAL